MKGRRLKYLVAGGIVVAALLGMIYSGVKESAVYFYTPSELTQKKESVEGNPCGWGGWWWMGPSNGIPRPSS